MRLDGGEKGEWWGGVFGESLRPVPPPSLPALGISFCALLVTPELGGVGAGQH